MELFIILFLFLCIIIMAFVIKNLYLQVIRYEDYIETYETWIDGFAKTVQTVDQELNNIDAAGTFRSDDEVGFFYQAMYSILKRLSVYGIIEEGEKEKQEILSPVMYAREREIKKRILKRKNPNIEIEDIQKGSQSTP